MTAAVHAVAERRPAMAEVRRLVETAVGTGGRRLDPCVRCSMETAFGHDFGRVRVHADDRASAAAGALGTPAFTVGRHVVFGRDRYPPAGAEGRRLLAHELAHTVQQGFAERPVTSLVASRPGDAHERDARRTAALALAPEPSRTAYVPARAPAGLVQRFSTSEHEAIGDRAYAQARPHGRDDPSAVPPPFPPDLVPTRFRYRSPGGQESTYGQLVTRADDVASFEEMEQRERESRYPRVPVLGLIWDRIGSVTQYLDLASRNRQHFHPHNFKAWQAYHWTAIRAMVDARSRYLRSVALTAEVRRDLREFDSWRRQAQHALEQRGALTGERADAARAVIDRSVAQMERLVNAATRAQRQAAALRQEARDLAVHAVALNGFGDHFLTDAFAGGHIVTPRSTLLDEYSTRLVGVFPVGGVLSCASVPSLAWHDLDNRFGVRVRDRRGSTWTTYGDNYLCKEGGVEGTLEGDACRVGARAPLRETETMRHVVDATSISIRQLWDTAAGHRPTGLFDVLDLLPRPVLDPAVYPAWTPADWEAQLRFASGEPGPPPPNPAGKVLGLRAVAGVPVLGPLIAFGAGCLNLLSKFSYPAFVRPMLDRIRREYNERFFVAASDQILSSEATPRPQATAAGHVVAGSLLAGLAGALIGGLGGGLLGAVIGGIVGLLGGAFVGGLLGRPRPGSE